MKAEKRYGECRTDWSCCLSLSLTPCCLWAHADSFPPPTPGNHRLTHPGTAPTASPLPDPALGNRKNAMKQLLQQEVQRQENTGEQAVARCKLTGWCFCC
ncbi:hypothetical protein XELAEV_18031889mg [Xenopus laevis]|uniref:Uncharacterized protein n=1 Tax=Xenopus laevis TaxID=8355 RepID=A0A974CNL3_XENLA|nr:hypothetical protein XELAEV_18031889mg [Xenopus laevis]